MALDDKWFELIKPINAKLPTRLSNTSYRDTRVNFFSSSGTEPIFETAELKCDLGRYREMIDELKNKVDQDKSVPEAVAELYQAKLEEKSRQIDLLSVLQKIKYNHCEEADLEYAQTLTEKIYTYPRQDIFNHLFNTVVKKLTGNWSDKSDTDSHQRLSSVFDKERPTAVLDCGNLYTQANLDNSTPITSAEMVINTFRAALKKYGLLDWSVEVNTADRAAIMVWPRGRRISIPKDSILKNRTNKLTSLKIEGLIQHEIFTHALRVTNGANSNLKLLSIGLDAYLRGEEGLAAHREWSVTGGEDYSGFMPYLVAGLAYGLDREGERRTFKEVFNIIKDYFNLLYGNTRDVNSLAFSACSRIFKVNHRFVFTRDCVYREGHIKVSRLLAEQKIDDDVLNLGKYDPTNKRHTKSLRQIEILK